MYLGDGTVVDVVYDQPLLELQYTGSSGSYPGFDRFGRVVDHKWKDNGQAVIADRFKYGYDRNSNRAYRENTLTSGHDELYAYDKLNRLTQAGRGTLNGTKDGFGPADETFRQAWGLDGLGNWDTFKEYSGISLTLDLDQSRTHNAVNEIDTDDDHGNAAGASITASPGTNWFDPTYDASGNMTAFPKPADPANGYTAVYDAWNRLVEVKDGSNTVAKYEYDGVGRRIVKQEYDTPGTHSRDRHYYYTAGWQVIEERVDSATLADQQYIWGLRYVDDLIMRDRDQAAGGNLGVTGSGMDERHYALHDAHFNITTLVDTAGDPVERYSYVPYGERTIYDANYTIRASSNYAWDVGHQGMVHDNETGLIYNYARIRHSQIGRWLQREPFGYVDGMSLYEYVGSEPIRWLDPTGMSRDTYEPDRHHHGGGHIDRYRNRKNVGRYRPDGTGIPHKGVDPPRIPKSDAKKFAKAVAKLLGRATAVGSVFMGDPLEGSPLSPAQLGGPSKSWFECRVKADVDDCYCPDTGERLPDGNRSCVYECQEWHKSPMTIATLGSYTEEYVEEIGCDDPNLQCGDFSTTPE